MSMCLQLAGGASKMGVITLNVVSQEKGTKKTMQFDPTTLVFDVCKVIREKLHMNVDRKCARLHSSILRRGEGRQAERGVSDVWCGSRLLRTCRRKLVLSRCVTGPSGQSLRGLNCCSSE